MIEIVAQSAGVAADTRGLGARCPELRDGDRLRWSRFVDATAAEGPGVRSALWVQGCAVRCPGCFNPHLWADRGARLDDTDRLAAEWTARALAAGAGGVTLLGGEPFDQAAALARVAAAFRAAGLSVMTFTGYTLAALAEWAVTRPDIAALLSATDLLCDGPYLRDLPDTQRPWIGSRNQSIRALSAAHADAVVLAGGAAGAAAGAGAGLAGADRSAERQPPASRDRLEIRLGADGSIAVNGWATDAALAALFDDLGVRADRPSDLFEEAAR